MQDDTRLYTQVGVFEVIHHGLFREMDMAQPQIDAGTYPY